MSSKFDALGDAISEALAAWSSAEFDEPADVEAAPRALGAWTQDLVHTYFRTGERLSATGIHPAVADQVWEAGSSALGLADDVDDLTDFSLVHWHPVAS